MPPHRTVKKAAPPSLLKPADYRSEIELISIEIEDAVVIHHTAEEINRLALHDGKVLKALQRDSVFWQTQIHCLQTSLFLTLSRIFDTGANTRTIHTLLNSTLANVHLFSASALAARKATGRTKPKWLDDYIARAWIPSSATDLRRLKIALKPYATRFEQVYRPIRHAIFAHRLMTNAEAGATLFQNTSRDEITKILDFLHDLIDAILDLYLNGVKPELGKRDFTEYNQRVRDRVAAVLRRLG
jgi:hypothetical protein